MQMTLCLAEPTRNKGLGECFTIVMDKGSHENGCRSVGLLTHGLIDRTLYYEHALILALAPFMHPKHYEAGDVEGRLDEPEDKEVIATTE